MRAFRMVALLSGLLGVAACEQTVQLDARAVRAERSELSDQLLAPKTVDRFFEDRRWRPVWDDAEREELRDAIAESAKDGLEPAHYHQAELARIDKALDGGDLDAGERLEAEARREVLFTDAFAALASHLAAGRVSAGSLKPLGIAEPAKNALEWNALPEGDSLEELLFRALRKHRVAALLDELRPQSPEYAALREALEKMRGGGDPEKIEAVEASLERMRWLPDDLGERHIEVDLPAFELALVEDGRETFTSRVVIGTNTADTPVFTSRVENLVLNPTWTVPKKILVEELAPKFRDDIDALEAAGFRVMKEGEEVEPKKKHFKEKRLLGDDPVTVVQDPGPNNPLGRVKFPLPGTPAIYLHDTPSRHAFERDVRTMSHGCIRVEKAWELATLLSGEDSATLERKAASREEKWMRVEPIRVHVVYRTVRANGNGELSFREDIYRRDPPLVRALRDLDASANRRE